MGVILRAIRLNIYFHNYTLAHVVLRSKEADLRKRREVTKALSDL